MSLTATYDDTLSRVRLSGTSLGSVGTALFQRSLDQVTWTTVRGGAAVAIASGAASLDDYEFAPGLLNYYRISVPGTPTFVAAGTAAHADNASVSPGLPAGHTLGDTLYLLAAIRNTAATVNTPTGYTRIANIGNSFALFSKKDNGAESSPTVTFSGGSAGDSCSAQLCAARGASNSPHDAFGILANAGPVQNIDTPFYLIGSIVDSGFILWCGWKSDDWTSVDVVTNGTEIGEPSTTLGNDQGIVWDYRIVSNTNAIAARTFTITGGSTAAVYGMVGIFDADRVFHTANLTPNMTHIWLKNMARPFLNRAIDVIDWSEETSPARMGVFDIVGRDVPIAVTDRRGSLRFELRVKFASAAAAAELRQCLSTGDPVFLHVPAGCAVPGNLHAVIGDLVISRTARNPARAVKRYGTLPVQQVAAPGTDVVGATVTWQGIVNAYATWQDLITAKATWQDVLESVGSPADVITP